LGKSRGCFYLKFIPIEPHGQLVGASKIGEISVKKLLMAVVLVVSFAGPAMAENFPNVYASHLGR
jgi:hypothetical protein